MITPRVGTGPLPGLGASVHAAAGSRVGLGWAAWEIHSACSRPHSRLLDVERMTIARQRVHAFQDVATTLVSAHPLELGPRPLMRVVAERSLVNGGDVPVELEVERFAVGWRISWASAW